MSRFRDAVLRGKRACENRLKMNNVYDCARPFLVLLGLFGVGGTSIWHSAGVYTLRNSTFSLLVFIVVSLVYSPWTLIDMLWSLFGFVHPRNSLLVNVFMIMYFLIFFLTVTTVGIGCFITHVYYKRLETMFKIINNIDNQLEQTNIKVKHWKITLTVVVLTLITGNYYELITFVELGYGIYDIVISVAIHLWYMWTILFLLIIQERFVGLNKILQENATATDIQIVGGRNPRDSYMLRRITLARHVHEQLTEVVDLFSDTCRYVIIGLLAVPIIDLLDHAIVILGEKTHCTHCMYSAFIQIIRIFMVIGICQANKAERRVLTARLRHLVATETDREIIQQVQQYIMYNAYSTSGLIDFQFTDIDNVLLFTIIDVIASNVLVIYSYTRQW